MAALQTLRNKPVLLMSIIGGALLLFIITMVMENQTGFFGPSDKAGEAFGNEIKVNDLESKIAEEQNLQEVAGIISSYLQTGKFDNQGLTEEQRLQIRQNVWDQFVTEVAIADECDKLGLQATEEDLKNALQNPEYEEVQFLMMVGAFAYQTPTIEGYRKFITEFDKLVAQMAQGNPEMAELFQNIKRACLYAESKLKTSVLEHKYLTLLKGSYTSNPISAKMNFDESNTFVNVAVAAIPYATIADDQVKVSDDELKTLYDQYKGQFRNPTETRSVKLLDYIVTPSAADNSALFAEVKALEDTLRGASTSKEVTAIVSGSKTTIPYNDIYFKKEAFQEAQLYEVFSQLDSMQVGAVTATKNDGKFVTTFKLVGRKSSADSLNIRYLTLRDKKQADSVLTAMKGGATWADMAKKLGQKDTTMWQPMPFYVAQPTDNDSNTYTHPCQLPLNTPTILGDQSGYVIAEVLDAKAYSEKFNVAVIKCPIEYSDDTYSSALSKLNNFVANHKDAAKFEEAAKKEGYTVYSLSSMTTSDYTQFVAQLGENSKETVRWIFDEAEAGQVSNVYETRNSQDASHLVVAAVVSVNEDDYLPWDNEDVKNFLTAIAKQNKKAEMILGKIKSVKSMADMQKLQGVQTDTLQAISLADYPYNEPRLAGVLAKANKGQFVGGIKGGSAIYAVQILEKTTGSKTFNADIELAKADSRKAYNAFVQMGMYGRPQMSKYPNALLNELITFSGKVKDLRYKF